MTVLEYAKAQGYDIVTDTGKYWKGYRVYEPDYNVPKYTGLPMSILVKDGKARMTTEEECFEVLDFIHPRGEDEE
nr:MAG TPA: hypothetical protein [Caudoviricetes sp.]